MIILLLLADNGYTAIRAYCYLYVVNETMNISTATALKTGGVHNTAV